MIEYSDRILPYDDFIIKGFCNGWQKPLTIKEIIDLLRNSSYRIIAVDTETKRIVGIITALSDEVNWAFIPDLEVVPEFKGRGIGKALLEKMLAKFSHMNCIDLTCDIAMQTYYEKFGMLRSNGMIIRKYLSE